jgi:hypothetical protein
LRVIVKLNLLSNWKKVSDNDHMKMILILSLTFLSASAFACGGEEHISQSDIDQQMAEMSKTLTAARASPEMRNGKVVGYRLMPSSGAASPEAKAYDRAGMVKLRAVNGVRVTDEAH